MYHATRVQLQYCSSGVSTRNFKSHFFGFLARVLVNERSYVKPSPAHLPVSPWWGSSLIQLPTSRSPVLMVAMINNAVASCASQRASKAGIRVWAINTTPRTQRPKTHQVSRGVFCGSRWLQSTALNSIIATIDNCTNEPHFKWFSST